VPGSPCGYFPQPRCLGRGGPAASSCYVPVQLLDWDFPALNFEQQRCNCAVAVDLGSACCISLWSKLPCLSRVWLSPSRPSEPLFTCAAVGWRITAVGCESVVSRLVLTYLSFSAGKWRQPEIARLLFCSGLAMSLSCGFLVKEKREGYLSSCTNPLYVGTSMGFWVFDREEYCCPISTASDFFFQIDNENQNGIISQWKW